MQENATTTSTDQSVSDRAMVVPEVESELVPELESEDAVFDHGLLGFAGARRFSISPWGSADGPFALMRSLDNSAEFLVADPEAFFPDYEPEIDEETAAWLGITKAEDAKVLVIISVPDRAEHATANLLGPLVINRHNHRSIQMVLNDPWDTRHPLFQASRSTAAQ